MTTATTNNLTNVIPLVRSEAGQVASSEKGAGHVFLGENGENERRGDATATRRGEIALNNSIVSDGSEPVAVANRLAVLLEKLATEKLAINVKGRTLAAEILTHPDTAVTLLDYVTANDASNSPLRYAQGMDALLVYLDVGGAVKTGELADKAATELLASRFIRDQVKDVLVEFGIFIKQENNTYRWASLPELQAMHDQLYTPKPANDLQLETADLQMTCNSPANENGKPANGLRMIGKKLAVNPLAKVRHWQRGQAMKSAHADWWKKVNADGTVEIIHNPYDLKTQCPRTEKEKELIRKAAIVDAETRLKLKIAAAGDKQLMQEIQRASLEADAQAQAIINESKLKLAQMQHERMMRRERLATYKTPLILAGLAAAVLFVVANNNGAGLGNDNSYPVELANMPLPAVGAVDAAGNGE